MMNTNEHLIDVENLYMYFPVTAGVIQKKVADVKAVDGVSFYIKKGETLVWWEKAAAAKLLPDVVSFSSIRALKEHFVRRIELSKLKKEQMRRMRRNMQLIFQDPFASLDPRMTAVTSSVSQ